MSRRARGGGASPERFLSRLREALGRFSEGVHDLGAPASEGAIASAGARLGGALPVSVSEVYRFADGMWLFDDVVRVRPLAQVEATAHGGERWLHLGTVDGAELYSDPLGAIFEEDDDGDCVCVAQDLEEALLAQTAREALLIDPDGEWREVFEPDGELSTAVRKKRNEVARRRATSARWLVEGAELALELDGDEDAAIELLDEAIAADRAAAAPCELRGLLLMSRGKLVEGAAALTAAADRSGQRRRADRAAVAAEATLRTGDAVTQARMAAMARAADPQIVARMSAEAENALDGGRLEDADRLTGMIRAIAGDDVLPRRLRSRVQLRTIR